MFSPQEPLISPQMAHGRTKGNRRDRAVCEHPSESGVNNTSRLSEISRFLLLFDK